MTVISIQNGEKQLIKRAISGNRGAQKRIYDRFAPKMLAVCRQYIRDIHFAEDAMVSGFVKVFANLEYFRAEGSFEGWIRTIMVRESISFLRKQQFVVFDEEAMEPQTTGHDPGFGRDEVEYLQSLIDELPEGYRMVFLLYAVEGYPHREIAETLQISEGTSKSQLHKARKLLQENLKLNSNFSRKAGLE